MGLLGWQTISVGIWIVGNTARTSTLPSHRNNAPRAAGVFVNRSARPALRRNAASFAREGVEISAIAEIKMSFPLLAVSVFI